MRKLFCSLAAMFAAAALQACWFTTDNFDGNFIAGVNNYCAHFNGAASLAAAVYYNGGPVSLPLTVYVKLSPRVPDQPGESSAKPILTATLQYKVKHGGSWGSWTTVKTFANLTWDLSFSRPVPLFGRDSICPRGLVAGDEIMVRLYLSDGVYESGDLSVDPGDVPDTATAASGGTYSGGWSAPFVFRMTFNGQYWR